MSPTTRVEIVGLKEERKAIEQGVALDIPVLIVGPTGCGKTTLVREVALEKGKQLVRISLNGEVGITELVGKWLIEGKQTKWQDGVLVDAMRQGHWVILDEINAALPEVLFCLNSILDDARALTLAEKDGEVVEAHPEFRVFGSMNPSEDYAGTKELNHALLSRFGIMLDTDYAQPKQELEIILRTGVEPAIAKIVVDVGQVVRKLHREHAITHQVSTRDLLVMARLWKGGVSLEEGLFWAILNKIHKEEQESVFKKIKEGLRLEINWESSAGTVLKNLTEDLVLSVEKLKMQEAQLSSLVAGLRSQLEAVAKGLPTAVSSAATVPGGVGGAGGTGGV